MTKNQMIRAIQGHDEALTLLDEMRAAVAGGQDAMLNLIEQMTTAARADTISDVIIDLKDFGQTEAVEIIKANY